MKFICYENNLSGVFTLKQLVHYYAENILILRESGYSSFEDWMTDMIKMQLFIEI